MSLPTIAIVIGTTRQNRFGPLPAQWIYELAQDRGDAAFELIDLRDHPLPFFDEPMPPLMQAPQDEEAIRWAARLAEFDGYVFVTAEYNHGLPAVLKNAIDYGTLQFNRKPVAFLGYGGVGAARSIEQFRATMSGVGAAPLKTTVNISLPEYLAVLQQQKTLSDFPYLVQSAENLLGEIVWWANALNEPRREAARKAAMG